MLACRLCRVPISAASGCAVCDPVRQNLVVAGEDEADRPSLSGTAALGNELLNQQLRGVQKDLKDNPRSPTAETRLLKLTAAAAKLLETSRKLIQDGVSAVETMSFREQTELFVTWYAALAPAYRADVLAKFAEHEREISRPVSDQAPPGN
jgi:hypothetical protein